jgi:hypothetical protein
VTSTRVGSAPSAQAASDRQCGDPSREAPPEFGPFLNDFKKKTSALACEYIRFFGVGNMESHMAGKLPISNFAHNHVCWFYPHFKAMKSQSFHKFSYQLPLTKNGLRSFNHV